MHSQLQLPGPARFIRNAARAVEEGYSVVVIFPEHMIDGGGAEAVLQAISSRSLATEYPDRAEGPLPDLIAESLGLSADWLPGSDPWQDLACWPHTHGRAACVYGWDITAREQLPSFLPAWEAIQHEAGIAPERRLRLLIGTGRASVEEAGFDRRQLMHMRTFWWWGAIDRLDTEFHLSQHDPNQSPDPLALSTLAEIVAWDLKLADGFDWGLEFAAHDLSGAFALHEDLASTNASTVPDLWASRTPKESRASPPPNVRGAWDAGLIELWDGRLRPILTQSSMEKELPTLLWRAQARVLFPYLEEHRARLEVLVREYDRSEVAPAGDGAPLELGPLLSKVIKNRVAIPALERRRLEAAKRVRNRLAHLETAPREDLRILLESLPL